MDKLELNGITCYVDQNIREGETDKLPVFLWCGFEQDHEPENTLKHIKKMAGNLTYAIIAYLVNDYNLDTSPWKAPAAFGTEGFGGGGKDTLCWMEQSLIPYVKNRFGEEIRLYTVGYSLAGLFSLWALYEKDYFSGTACCSGSLWYKDWDIYMNNRHLSSCSDVYLSLGGKEEKTKNPVMSTVGERTRRQEQVLAHDEKAKHVILEWNNGGHFTQIGNRIAKGIKWLLEVDDHA